MKKKKRQPRVNGVEQPTVDSMCRQCCVLSLTDCQLLSDNVLRVCELSSPSQSKCLCFIGLKASSAKLVSRNKASGMVIVKRRPVLTGGALPGHHGECRRRKALCCRRGTQTRCEHFVFTD